jgi:NAD(P)H dehydrogenase (quinone)
LQHAVVLAHPDPSSFNAAVARRYAHAAAAIGQSVGLRDLYALGFDPRLRSSEFPWRSDFAPGADVMVERAALASADVIVFVYPLWFNAPPAMLKGYVDRVLGAGFGFAAGAGGAEPLLSGKRLVTISTSGAPDAWVSQTRALEHLRAGFDNHIAAVCGLTVIEHLHLGGVTPGMRDDAAEELLSRVSDLVVRHFGPASG